MIQAVHDVDMASESGTQLENAIRFYTLSECNKKLKQ